MANNALVSLANSFQTAPNFWLSPQGVTYNVATQTPQYRMDSVSDLQGMPVIGDRSRQRSRSCWIIWQPSPAIPAPAVASQYDIQPVIDIYASAQDRDLGGVSGDVDRVVKTISKASFRAEPRWMIRGQVETMQSSFSGLAIGLVFSIVLVYLLMVVNFQSWVDPFIIITALPGALPGSSGCSFSPARP